MDLITFNDEDFVYNKIVKYTVLKISDDMVNKLFSDVPIYSAYINLSAFSQNIEESEIMYERNRPRDLQKIQSIYTYLCTNVNENGIYPTQRWDLVFGSLNFKDLRLIDGAHRFCVSKDIIGLYCKVSIYDFPDEVARFQYFKNINKSTDMAEYYRLDSVDQTISLTESICHELTENGYIQDSVDYWQTECKIPGISTPFLNSSKVKPIIAKLVELYHNQLSEFEQISKLSDNKKIEIFIILNWINEQLVLNPNKYVGQFNSYKFFGERSKKCLAIKRDGYVCDNSNAGGNKLNRCGTHKDEKYLLGKFPQYSKCVQLAKESGCALGFIWNESDIAVMFSLYKHHQESIL